MRLTGLKGSRPNQEIARWPGEASWPAGTHTRMRRARDDAWGAPWLTLLLVAGLLFGGCGLRGSAATPLPTPTPVQLALALTQEGKVTDGTIALTASVTVTNHLAESISLISLCGYSFRPPYLKLDLYMPPSTVSLWRNASSAHNPFCTSQDLVRIARGSLQSWTVPIDISKVPAEEIVHGAIYRVVVYVQWHTGLLPTDVVEAAKILHEPSAQADITLT